MNLVSRWPQAKLGEVIQDTQYGTALKANDEGRGLPVVRMNNIAYDGSLDLSSIKHVELPDRDREQYSLRRGDLLFNRTNSPELVGKTAVWNRDESYAFAGYLVRLRVNPALADPTFMAAWFNTPEMKTLLRARAKPSINMANINATEALKFPVILPPLDEQRRIADILDRAEALRVKRRAALAQLDTLTQAIFLDLFGDPVTNPHEWPVTSLATVLAKPLRNGVSPSSTGTVQAKVLTLSAVTGDSFEEQALKVGTFLTRPPADQSVNQDDLLICRGNGNIRLVGKGYFPRRSMPEVTFPDTIIAARVNTRTIARAFLQHVWNTRFVRTQIEGLARTTNGTFKINQTVLEGIRFASPPVTLQEEFAQRIAAVETLKSAQRRSLAELDALFASLQHRAFRGEL